MKNCECCGIHIVYGRKCDPCNSTHAYGYGYECPDEVEQGDCCDPAVTWHCFTGHCDGSGCTYAGECES